MSILSDRLRNLRIKRGYTVDDMVKACGVSRATYYRMENGEFEKVSLDIIRRIAEMLGVDPCYLAGWRADKREVDSMNEDERLVYYYHNAVPKYKALAMELLMEHQEQKDKKSIG